MFKKNTTMLFFASAIFVCACLFYVYSFMNKSRDEVVNFINWTEHSKEVISQTNLSLQLLESMLAEQRGLFITGDKKFVTQFQNRQDQFRSSVNKLIELTNDNIEQSRRANKIAEFSEDYISYLNQRKDRFKEIYKAYNQTQINDFIESTKDVEALHDKLNGLMRELLKEEYVLLKGRMVLTDKKRDDYGRNMILSLIGACGIIMLMNWVLFQAQKRFYLDSERLRNIDDRHKIAVKATNDGVFDWDIKGNNIFLSAQIFKMCGYEKEDYDGSMIGLVTYMLGINPFELLHPDDAESFKKNIEYFVDGLTSEYNSIYRVRHVNGYWIWIHARGGGVFGKDGKPTRLIGTHTDISIQKKMEERHKKEIEESQNSSKSKMEFLAHMSHEIRTPLTTVTGVAEILERQSSSFSDKEKTLIKTLVASSATLKDLINDVLDFSRIDSGEIKLENNAIQVNAMMAEILSIMTVQAAEKGLNFSANYGSIAELVFEADQIRLRQILINLVGNAIKFTQHGSVKILSLIQNFNTIDSTATLVIKVSDTGIGISPQHHEIIFDKFKQVDDTISKGFGGTGLGLPISKSLTEMMGGKLLVDSEVDRGSTFTLEIPIKILNLEDFLTKSGILKLANAINTSSHDSTKSSPPVLMVEDYEGNIVVIGCILEELGLRYDIARNGLEAVDMFCENKYQLILMDLQMPKMDGLTATIKIREIEKGDPNLSPTPIIGMTAHATHKDKSSCLECGMNEFMTKPIDQAKLVGTLMQYIHKD